MPKDQNNMGPDRPSALAEVVSLDEQRLLLRHSSGDPDAFAELLARFRDPVFSYLVRCGVELSARDDLAQEIFLGIHRGAAAYKPERPVVVWVFTIAANAVRSHFRKQVRAKPTLPTEGLALAGQGPNSQQVAEAREAASWLEAAIGELPLVQREVIVLTSVKELTLAEIAVVLELPVNTVKTHLRRARLSLAKALARRHCSLQREVAS